MDIKINAQNQKRSVTIWPKKLYTQDEVDNLLQKKDNIHSSLTKKIEEEAQTADKQKRLNTKTVANLVKRSNRILLSISSHAFPFDLVPDTLNIE